MNKNLCWKTVTYEQDGQIYVGYYIIEGSTITVTHEDSVHGDCRKSTMLIPGELGALRTATALLGEMIRELEMGAPA